MTLIIKKPTGAKLVMRQTWQPMDPDAAAYITAVEAADTAAGSPGGLEERTKIAIDNFVLGCKADGIWNAIKASCILAGARTLSGALVPLVGTAPTNFNFVSGDYNRKTGLAGDGATKYLNANRVHNADPQNNRHIGVFISNADLTSPKNYLGVYSASTNCYTVLGSRGGGFEVQLSSSGSGSNPVSGYVSGFAGGTRSDGSTIFRRHNQTESTYTRSSLTPGSEPYFIFAANESGPTLRTTSRLAFYSIGESLDLALLDARVTDLINAIGAAIP